MSEEEARPPPPLASVWRRRRALRIGGQLFLELLVVFSGVYAAFMLSQYQQERQAAERREQIRAALVAEIETITANTRPVATGLPTYLSALDSLIRAGARPPLRPQITAVRFDTHMWASTLQSGGLDLFDVSEIYALSEFYNGLNAGFDQIEQLRSLSESILIPNLNAGPDEFYDTATGMLRPKYHWNVEGYERLADLAETITQRGDSLVVELSR